ncbi:MAG TPA: hypothetical protein VH012_02010 [Acidimicrobiales bacterium]|jgi:hypothetical protein|nr:hypothetical protein [Acidimicrobiales bacterium]
MIQTRAVQSQAEAHRQDLMAAGGHRRGSRRTVTADQAATMQRSATGLPVPGGRAVHRAMAPRLGAWLIEFGTKLGGATIRTS